jgi:dTDP-4-amino-4,6-dideoxygalactose transaminase
MKEPLMASNYNHYDIYLSPPHLSGEEERFVREAFESNYIAPLGPQVDAFEKEFCEMTGIPYAVAVSSGTAAMHLALRILGVGPGDEVMASTLTFIGSVSPIWFQGASPVFIDSDTISWNMDPTLLAEELAVCRKAGRSVKAVIPTDLYGQCADMDAIGAVCKEYGVPLISDSAESLGATYMGRAAGVGARAAVYSFNGNKIVTTSGGGMLASPDAAFIDRARYLATQAREDAPHYEHVEIGYNYRMSNVLGAIGRGQLHALPERVNRRREIFSFYRDGLKDLAGVSFMPEASYGKANRWLSVVLFDEDQGAPNRETVRLALEAARIESRPLWKPMHQQPVFQGCRVRGGAVSEELFRKGLCLPSGTALKDNQLSQIVEIVRGCF